MGESVTTMFRGMTASKFKVFLGIRIFCFRRKPFRSANQNTSLTTSQLGKKPPKLKIPVKGEVRKFLVHGGKTCLTCLTFHVFITRIFFRLFIFVHLCFVFNS